MDNSLNRIEEKIDRLDLRLDGVDKTLVRQNSELESHIKRTELLEGRIDPLEKYVWMAIGGIGLLSILATAFALLKTLF